MLPNCLCLELTPVSRQIKASSKPAPSTHGEHYDIYGVTARKLFDIHPINHNRLTLSEIS